MSADTGNVTFESLVVQQATNERLDDIRELLADAGAGRPSRAELIRSLVFALPLDGADHVRRIVQVGRLRLYEDVGAPWSVGALAEAEWLLGWYAEDVDRAALVAEIERLRRVIGGLRWRLRDLLKDVEAEERE